MLWEKLGARELDLVASIDDSRKEIERLNVWIATMTRREDTMAGVVAELSERWTPERVEDLHGIQKVLSDEMFVASEALSHHEGNVSELQRCRDLLL